MKQTMEIELEFSETVTYDSRHDRFAAHCPQCNAATQMATTSVAARLRRIPERDLFRLLEGGAIHFFEQDRILVCLNSLARVIEVIGSSRGLLPEVKQSREAEES